MQAKKKIKIKKQVVVLEILPKDVDKYWSLVNFILRESLRFEGDPFSIEELKKYIKDRAMQLFMMFGSDDGKQHKVFGVCVTRILQLPNFPQCEVILLRGEKRELWQDELADTIENLAHETNCKRIAVHARPGWQPFLKTKGWLPKRYLFVKEINT